MDSLGVLIAAAVAIGFFHTLIGIDHTLPFVVLGRARGWSIRRTLLVTSLCGAGHVASSVLLGGLGIWLAVSATGLDPASSAHWLRSRLGAFELVEATRGELASLALIVFGLVYAAWSLARARRGQRQAHAHADGVVHSHAGGRNATHDHGGSSPASLTAWSLFVIFVLGPCEPLIPLLMAPAVGLGLWAVVPVVAAFAATTLATMLALVLAGSYGLRLARVPWLEAHAHTLSGLAIAGSGVGIHFLGL